jgi:hypothetical protein
MQHNCLRNGRELCFCNNKNNNNHRCPQLGALPTNAHSICIMGTYLAQFLEVLLVSLLRHNRPQHPTLHSTAQCIITICIFILITRGVVTHLPKTTSKWPQRRFWVTNKKVHRFGGQRYVARHLFLHLKFKVRIFFRTALTTLTTLCSRVPLPPMIQRTPLPSFKLYF